MKQENEDSVQKWPEIKEKNKEKTSEIKSLG